MELFFSGAYIRTYTVHLLVLEGQDHPSHHNSVHLEGIYVPHSVADHVLRMTDINESFSLLTIRRL